MKVQFRFMDVLKPVNPAAHKSKIRRLIQTGIQDVKRFRFGNLQIGANRKFAGVWWHVVAVGREGFIPTVDWKRGLGT